MGIFYMITVRELHPLIGVEVQGVQARFSDGPVSNELQSLIEQRGLILLRDQDLSEDNMIDLAQRLGGVSQFLGGLQDNDYVYRISNLDSDGKILPLDDNLMRSNLANELWHTDSTYQRPRTRYSMLYALIPAEEGGDTEFCDTRCAYEALSMEEQRALEGKTAYHSLLYSRALLGFTDWTDEQRALFKPIARPLVQLHEASGRKAICLASHIEDVDPLPREEAQELLAHLVAVATASDKVYTHKWRPRDLIIWDNRCTMHRARPYPYSKCKREYRTSRVVDDTDFIDF